MKGRIYDFLQSHAASNRHRLHMPGHKGNFEFFPQNLCELDITEIMGADNLMEADGIIADFQRGLAAIYGASSSFFLVNGASCGIIGAVLALCGQMPDGKILVVRGAHKSLYSGMILAGVTPMYVLPPMIDGQFAGSVSTRAIEDALQIECVSAVFVTSPTYEGIISDIAKISKICHNYGVPLIVDEAHGAHLAWGGQYFPDSAIACGADVVIHSLHKTLPVLGQAAAVHVSGSKASASRIKECINLVQTTSPSYLMMAQADYALAKLNSNPDYFKDYRRNLQDLHCNLSALSHIKTIGVPHPDIFNFDPSKITLRLPDGITASLLESHLAQEGIDIEATMTSHIIAMTSCADNIGTYHALTDALRQFDDLITTKAIKPENKTYISPSMINPIVRLSPKQAFTAKSAKIPMEKSIGQVSAQFIIPYPPGVPIVAPGEEITSAVIEEIASLTVKPLGFEGDEISVVK